MSKRPPSPTLIPNPFVKKRNLEWTLQFPSADDSYQVNSHVVQVLSQSPTTAAIEAGTTIIDDHLTHFTTQLSKSIPPSSNLPLSIPSYSSLYTSNAGSPEGAHFVIHQHDHPVAGTHYDLRLQINETSSASWAIMYGLPGDPNSVRLNRNATETRVHCLWNHLIETASEATGSLLIWDTGTYTILPRQSKHAPKHDPSSPPTSPPSQTEHTQQSLLHAAFQNRKIRLRLHGSRLPDPYILNLRLTKSEDAGGRARSSRTPKYQRRKGVVQMLPETSSEDESEEDVIGGAGGGGDREVVSATEREIREMEDEEVRRTNAYPGAKNSIGSVHQRRWYLSLDRTACGFAERKRHGRSVWELKDDGDGDEKSKTKEASNPSRENGRLCYPFYVRGVDYETSVVTTRRGADILRDEGVKSFTQRKGWNPVLR
ncbi:Fc.00g021210.m01.CDS01 [Cosmosporella sp. VM-42]